MAETDTRPVEDRIADHLFGEEKTEQVEESDDQADVEEGDQSEESEVAPQQTAVEEVEIEVEGWKGKIPAKLKAEIDKAADYTRKTQETADQRRLFDAKQRAQQEQQAFYQSASQEFEQLRQIEAQLEQYRKVDLSQIDGETLSRMSMAAANLREEKAKLSETINGKRGEFRTKMVGAWDDMAAKAHDAVTRSISDWDAVAPKVAEYAIREGYPFELITGYDRTTRERVGPGVVDATFARTLYKAWKYDQLQSTKTTDKTAKAAPFVKPGATDTRSAAQVSQSNFKRALKGAKSDRGRADLIAGHLLDKFKM